MATTVDARTQLPSDAELDRLAIDWLLSSDEPGIRMQARRDLLGEDTAGDEARVLNGPMMTALLEGQQPDGGFGVDVYSKWKGAHWRLVSLVELGVPAGEPRALAAYETVLRWLTAARHLKSVPEIDGRSRRCASQEGNALAVGVRLGLAGDPRVRLLAESLMGWQWPDGGWNCVRTASTTHSSFYETVTPLWGLAEYATATGDRDAAQANRRTAGFFLDHEVYRSHRTGAIGDPRWLELHWPPYYAYDVLWGLTVLARAGALPDARAEDALELVRSKRLADGRWPAEGGIKWRTESLRRRDRDVVAWPRSGPSEMLTLNAVRVLRAALA
ncbi:MAG: hypothetical protein QOH61_507 [Chloroflexota bacterium]|jgi:hypothetical protein|nr:hypothetical protein [Chloroflexota bacterium]